MLINKNKKVNNNAKRFPQQTCQAQNRVQNYKKSAT